MPACVFVCVCVGGGGGVGLLRNTGRLRTAQRVTQRARHASHVGSSAALIQSSFYLFFLILFWGCLVSQLRVSIGASVCRRPLRLAVLPHDRRGECGGIPTCHRCPHCLPPPHLCRASPLHILPRFLPSVSSRSSSGERRVHWMLFTNIS